MIIRIILLVQNPVKLVSHGIDLVPFIYNRRSEHVKPILISIYAPFLYSYFNLEGKTLK